MRKKLRRIFAWALAICLIMTVINVPREVRAEGTLITGVSLTNNSIPKDITADMKITADMQSADCGTEGCSVTASEWNVISGGGAIASDTVLNAGDTICQTLTITALEGYEFDASLNSNAAAVTFNDRQATNVTLYDMTQDGKNELIVGIEYTVQSGGNQPGGGEQSYTVNFGTGSWTVGDVNVTADKRGEQNLAYADVINLTGFNAETMEAKLTAESGFTTTLTVTGNSTSLSARINTGGGLPNEIMTFSVEAKNSGGDQPGPGGNTDGPDGAPTANAAKVQFYDRFENNFTYEEFKRANLGTVQYSTDSGITWNEFTSEQVTSDAKLLWYTDKTDPEPANWKQIYYFNSSDVNSVKLKVTAGNLSYRDSASNITNLEIDKAYDLLTLSSTLSIFPQDDGIRNITWSDEAQTDDQRVEHGKVIIESAVIGEENALFSESPYSQQGNKGYIGVKGGATVTVKLIPDYGYQVGSLSLNGQTLTPQAEEATYTFIMPGTNLHLAAVFVASSDEINATAQGVNGGSITGGENVIESGNLRLSVTDSNMNEDQKNAMNNSAAATDVTITNYLGVDLEKFVKKGNSSDEWTEDLEELSNKIKIVLNVGTNLDANKTYVVVREHNGIYEQIPATYDKTTGTLTFESDKFSDYAVGTMENNNKNDDSNNNANNNSNENSSTNNTTNQDNPTKKDDVPKTGDNTPIEWYITLTLISGIGLLITSKKRIVRR